MSTEQAFVTIKEAAALARCSRMTIVRAVARGEIEQLEQAGQEGKKVTVYVRRSSVLAWKDTRPVTPERAEQVEGAQVDQLAHGEQHGQAEHALHAMNLLADALERTNAQVAEERARADRAERLLVARDHELGSFRRALGEQAESLAQERARIVQEQDRVAVEQARALAAQIEAARVAQDALHAQNQLAQVAQERDQLAQDAQAAREELEKLKLSIPAPKIAWGTRVKRMLGLKAG